MPSNHLKTAESKDSGVETVDEIEQDGEHKGGERKKEIGGRDGPEPTRYGDWEKNGRCIDF